MPNAVGDGLRRDKPGAIRMQGAGATPPILRLRFFACLGPGGVPSGGVTVLPAGHAGNTFDIIVF
ncbi:hypothetical protein GCM10011348_01930 [Marinobacterium nitratireducens]|uniref:Uncharacterized protein n=1 Tax=Marinobacterium nitratireducens TaxID=518897 RepID=A0A917Z8C7_9GAMM|nr:hypothetical protein GCM10011348_01930 [Marinobacterium nitratireducens]